MEQIKRYMNDMLIYDKNNNYPLNVDTFKKDKGYMDNLKRKYQIKREVIGEVKEDGFYTLKISSGLDNSFILDEYATRVDLVALGLYKDYRKTYNEKNGLISKTYKLSAELTGEFKKACEDKSESQAQALTRLMQNYINDK